MPASLQELNPLLFAEAIEEAMARNRIFDGGSLMQKNEQFTDRMQSGAKISYFDGKEQHSVKCAGIIVFINNLPLIASS